MEELTSTASELNTRHWKLQQEAGIDIIPTGDFAFYDHMLEAIALLGAAPPRYGPAEGAEIDLETYFAMARGRQDETCDVTAMEMTKWFDTNYHYIVPEFYRGMDFRLASSQPFTAVESARSAGVTNPRPVLIGPVTFLLLGKTVEEGVDLTALLDSALDVYAEVLERFAAMGIEWVQIDEPELVMDLSDEARTLFDRAYNRLVWLDRRPRIMLATYFGGLRDNAELALGLEVDGLHLDLVRAPEQLENVLAGIGETTVLSLGVIDGRNVWRTDLDRALSLLRRAADAVGTERIQVAPSCSLLHCPIDLDREKTLDPEVKEWLAFGKQKLQEVAALTRALNEGESAVAEFFEASRDALERRHSSPRVTNHEVQQRLAAVTDEMTHRATPFPERIKLQQARLKLPPLPATTIGSFPQTREVRRLRADLKKGEITLQEYENTLEEEITRAIRFQEETGIDLLVHGESERGDMVEYFGEQLEGFIFTRFGWVQSYGSRATKPPIIFGDVHRPAPMTVRWSRFAQDNTTRPMKGMLTGPVTMMQWSFVRDDQPHRTTCRQLALAIRDEVLDLEQAGIKVIQIDEPAMREGLPLRRSEWGEYLAWAVRCFRLASSGVEDGTQIHTHMCYSEFNDIIESIAEMDADVISIEASRSRMELLNIFEDFVYPNCIGPGVYDIHSPRVPSSEEIIELLHRAMKFVSVERLWVNPDCGLKTRDWPEVRASLRNMVAAVREVRKEIERSSV